MDRKVISVQRIIACENVESPDFLLEDVPCQSLLCDNVKSTKIKQGGYIILDFGKEIHGGIKYAIQTITSFQTKMRIVFGESVMETLSHIGKKNATNHHAIRDMVVNLAYYAQEYVGNTGFRFVKLEAIDGDICLRHVDGILEYRDIPYLGTFESNDPLLNQIWNTAAYTVHLNMQDYLWDGIKRDRLVWIGDMHPEVSTILSVFGNHEVVTKSLDLIKSATPPTSWMNGIASYSMWWIIIQRDWYWYTGDYDYLSKQAEYLYEIINHIMACVQDDGHILVDNKFVDWASKDTKEMDAGFHAVVVLGLRAAKELCNIFGNIILSKECSSVIDKIKGLELDYTGNKQISALMSLADLEDENIISHIILKDGAYGLSTFLGCYTLQAVKNRIPEALDLIRNYWGKMIELGATTFWEDFDITWAENAGKIDTIIPNDKKDIHGDFGRYCYEGFRHSLCHGWSSGPVPFLSRYVLGITPVEPGFSKVRIQPNLGDLTYVKGSHPTPYGLIEVEYTLTDGELIKNITLPEGITLIS